MNMSSGVYKIICRGNNKIYIGSSQNLEKRIKHHFTALSNNRHKNPHLQSAYNLYGNDQFDWIVLENCDIDELLLKEQYWMDDTRCYDRLIGFNNTRKSDRPEGYKHTDENKAKISKLKKGLSMHPNTKKALISKNMGRKNSTTTLKKMSESKIGEKNPMWGYKEPEDNKKKRMVNFLAAPKWNKGLTKNDDPRIAKLGEHRKGLIAQNALACELVDIENNISWVGSSLKDLAKSSPLSISSINRIRAKTCSKSMNKKYKLKINES